MSIFSYLSPNATAPKTKAPNQIGLSPIAHAVNRSVISNPYHTLLELGFRAQLVHVAVHNNALLIDHNVVAALACEFPTVTLQDHVHLCSPSRLACRCPPYRSTIPLCQLAFATFFAEPATISANPTARLKRASALAPSIPLAPTGGGVAPPMPGPSRGETPH